MPTPLPAPYVGDYSQTLNAFRMGEQDKIARDKAALMKEAGGLAAAGNMKGAMSKLYGGGQFDEARGISGELRAQAAEGRAAASHASSMANAKLEREAKTHEMFARLIPTIQTPEQLQQAVSLIKQRTGMDFSQVTMEQLPMLYQQSISIEQQLKQKIEAQRLMDEQAKATQDQANKDRDYDLNVRKVDVLQNRINAKANAPKPLTEGQRKAQSYLNVMKDAQTSLTGTKEAPGPLATDEAESPMGSTSSWVSNNLPDEAGARYRSKTQNQFYQAAEQWVIAKLRHQSGATISPDEIRKEMRTFFPVPGDDQRTRMNKARARREVERSLEFEATGEVAQSQGNNIGDMSDDDILKGLGLN